MTGRSLLWWTPSIGTAPSNSLVSRSGPGPPEIPDPNKNRSEYGPSTKVKVNLYECSCGLNFNLGTISRDIFLFFATGVVPKPALIARIVSYRYFPNLRSRAKSFN
ncbi:hypothetical protein J6590_104578, partial [Homalodisca vitripennis]